MTHDPEAAWPLTTTESGYYPSANPVPHLPPSNLVPLSSPMPPASTNAPSGSKPVPAGVRIAYLSIILGAAIPLTAIAGSYMGILGMAVAWAGIVLVAAFTLGRFTIGRGH